MRENKIHRNLNRWSKYDVTLRNAHARDGGRDLQLDLSLLLATASTHPSQQYVQAVASSIDRSWLRLWDLALEKGVFGTTCVQLY